METDKTKTVYGDKIDGDEGNYRWTVRFDKNKAGYVGITQWEGTDVKDRVLLSPEQVRELRIFLKERLK